MFFKKSDYKKLKEELDEKLADFSETGILHLPLKDLRAQHKQLCALRDEYKDHFDALEKKYVKTLNKKMYAGLGAMCGGIVPVVVTASAIDVIAFGGLATGTTMAVAGIVSVGESIINIDKVRNIEKPLNNKIQAFEWALDIKKTHTRHKLIEKHSPRKAFIAAERDRRQKEKIAELEQKLNGQQQKVAPVIQKTPIHKPKGQNNVL